MNRLLAVWTHFLVLWALSCPASVLYVDLSSINPSPPYTNWATAAATIQDAVDASTNGDLVLVTNGVYATGGKRWFDSGTNRVAITNVITLQSVNGPAFTSIVGTRVAGSGLALTNAARCVMMTKNAIVSGFTLTNGQGGTGNYPAGGGVQGGIVTNCVLVNNLATNAGGGGAYRSTLINCQLVGNSASSGGGACASTLSGCLIVSNSAVSGGGIYGGGSYGASVLTNCILTGNSATASGGGAYGGTLSACLVISNTAPNGGGTYVGAFNDCVIAGNRANLGGGGYQGTFTNCTVVANVATNSGGGIYGGSGARSYNSIIYYNTAPTGENHIGAKFNFCCTVPSGSSDSLTNEPGFVSLPAGNCHLQTNSPCINSGNNAFVMDAADVEGNPRISGGTVDMGAYEFPDPTSTISCAWLQQYGIAADGSADFADNDGDGMNNWQEWIGGTNPTNAVSVLAMGLPKSTNTVIGILVSWQSVAGRTYDLQRGTSLSGQTPFSSIQSNIYGQAGKTSFTDATATNPGPYFYRVGVQR